jgi:hypothetical protein
MQETLSRLRVENIIPIQLEKWDEFSENWRIELRIRVTNDCFGKPRIYNPYEKD